MHNALGTAEQFLVEHFQNHTDVNNLKVFIREHDNLCCDWGFGRWR